MQKDDPLNQMNIGAIGLLSFMENWTVMVPNVNIKKNCIP